MCSACGNKGPAAGNILLYAADATDATGRVTARVSSLSGMVSVETAFLVVRYSLI